jgi:hypothetical protein
MVEMRVRAMGIVWVGRSLRRVCMVVWCSFDRCA